MSATPPHAAPATAGDKTPELVTREKRPRQDDGEDDRDRAGRSHRYRRDGPNDGLEHEDSERERRRHRHRDETEEERRERHRRRDAETEEEREDRRRRRRERDEREREERERGDVRRDSREGEDLRRGSREISVGRPASQRDRSRESHRSYRSHRDDRPPVEDVRDRRGYDDRREDRGYGGRRGYDDRRDHGRRGFEERGIRPMRSPLPMRRRTPDYDQPPRRRGPPPQDVDPKGRTVFVSQLSAKMTSRILGMFFEDKLGPRSVREARVVTDRGGRRSRGIGHVELDSVDLVNKALELSGTVVMGIPISILLSENDLGGQELITAHALASVTNPSTRPPPSFGTNYPPLSSGLDVPQGFDPNLHKGNRLFVTNLPFSLGPTDLKQVFEPFGAIEFVDLHMDNSGMKKGTAYVQYKELRPAQMAQDAMAGFELAGRPIRVQQVQDRSFHQTPDMIDDSQDYGTKLDATQRQQLMYKLARTEAPPAARTDAPSRAPAPAMNPSPFLVVSNMFNPEEETERNWDLDLAEDVKGEVESKYGKVVRIKVEKMSAGEVYIEFAEVESATNAIRGLNGRFFGGRMLMAGYISEALFKAHL
ncbi:hypothetical protein I350_03994 [Cryptococcus amylolentus CBS 6273]|uniref:RRM domain-containing protein n=1 Tax=Cryptococcus amylolentus CBS 6273 TaxID=1296118 RepID=A0A1E3K0Q8_9TREE|nr:hypothetical protein I350_03994 [Cryptococcus amylolentus CBS 6273]